MLASLLLTAALWPLSASQQCAPQETTIIIGIAKNVAGELLYCEIVSQPTPTSVDINYVRNAKKFAEKKITYGENSETPSILQQDFRFGEMRQAEITSQQVHLNYQANKNKKIRTTSIPTSQVDVIDAGFDNYIRHHWDELLAGKILPVNFASVSHLKTLPLRISAQASEQCVHPTNQNQACFYFLVEIDNALFRLLLGKLTLIYDNQRRLVNFNGVVNIIDDKQSTQTATITYYYKQDYVNH